MAKRKAKQRTAVTLQPIDVQWPAFDLAELFTWADNELAAVVQFPDISDVVQPPKWDETGAISSKVELP